MTISVSPHERFYIDHDFTFHWNPDYDPGDLNAPIVVLGYAPCPPKWINPVRKMFPRLTNRQFARRMR